MSRASRRSVAVLTLALCAVAAARAEVYQEPGAFVAEVFGFHEVFRYSRTVDQKEGFSLPLKIMDGSCHHVFSNPCFPSDQNIGIGC